MATKDLGRLYHTTIRLPKRRWPPAARSLSMMADPPFRVGRGIALRPSTVLAAVVAGLILVFSRPDDKAHVFGWWSRPFDDGWVSKEQQLLHELKNVVQGEDEWGA